MTCCVCDSPLPAAPLWTDDSRLVCSPRCLERAKPARVSRQSYKLAQEARIIERSGLPRQLSYFTGQRAARGRR